MDELRVATWKRYGQDRVYVNLPNGESVAWLDRRTGQTKILVERYGEAALAMLAPYLAPTAPPPPERPADHRPPQALPPPTEDLALHRPGVLLESQIARLSPSFWERVLAWLLRRPLDADSWRTGLAGERVVGAQLERLVPYGWRVLHSIPLPRDVDLDHLLIGPGGVFAINTKHYPGKDVWIGDTAVRVNFGPPQQHVRKSRAEARRAARVLRNGCGFAVPVTPVLVFVGAAKLDRVPTLRDVHVYRDGDLAALATTSGALTEAQTAAVYAVARDRRNWAGA